MAGDESTSFWTPNQSTNLGSCFPLGQITTVINIPNPNGFVACTTCTGDDAIFPGAPGEGLDCTLMLEVLVRETVFPQVPDAHMVVVGARCHIVAGPRFCLQCTDLSPVKSELVDYTLFDTQVIDQNTFVLRARVHDVVFAVLKGRYSFAVFIDLANHSLAF